MIDLFRTKFPFYKQQDSQDCAPACLKMIFRHYGKKISLESIKEAMYFTRQGVSLYSISLAAEKYHFQTFACEAPIDHIETAQLPAILHWNEEHFVVLYKIENGLFSIADPQYGLIKYSKEELAKSWCFNEEKNAGIMLLLQPTPAFYKVDSDTDDSLDVVKFARPYISKFKQLWIQFIFGIILGGAILYSIPLLTRVIVDVGIGLKDINLIYIILLGQLILFLSSATVELIRRWIIVYLSSKISIFILSDYIKKLMRLPLRFFDTKIVGDILQRIQDHERIQSFISGSSINFLVSIVVFVTFSVVLALFDSTIFLTYIALSVVYVVYAMLFLKKREELEFRRFNNLAQNQSTLIEMIHGMQEIKLSNSELIRREGWNAVQEKMFKLNVETNKLSQAQDLGSRLINDFKNIVITAISATAVVKGHFTLGQMITVQFIIGQLNLPLNDFLNFLKSLQDTKISLRRITDIHKLPDEESVDKDKVKDIQANQDIAIQNLSFSYEGENTAPILDDLSLTIQKGKITAIVGSSGSGKTTLMKLLLKYYNVPDDTITVGGVNLNSINSAAWRSKCGAVLQDGYLFSESVAKNVALSESLPDNEKVERVLSLVNLKDFVDSLPQGLSTKIGKSGLELSVGQKQRVLIARALYKNPEYLFLDEATSSLDAQNESVISNNLYNHFYKDKTVLIIAHRLSTVKNAHMIAVLENGKIVEKGTHIQLLQMKGKYYDLVNNQLELS